MRTRFGPKLHLSLLFTICVISLIGFDVICRADAMASEKYSYVYKNETLTLTPSTRFVVLEEDAPSLDRAVKEAGLIRDVLSDEHALKSRGLGVYRELPSIDVKKAPSQDLSQKIPSLMDASQGVVQPLFEQGGAILIPSDEVIVGFKTDTSLKEAEAYFSPFFSSQDILAVTEFRKNSYILKIDFPSDGRAFTVSHFFSQLDEIRYAEPNHIVVMTNESVPFDELDVKLNTTDMKIMVGGAGVDEPQAFDSTSFLSDGFTRAAPNWTTLASIDFEGTYPPSSWLVANATGYTAASWGKTNYRSHGGSYSAYCAALGSSAVTPPGPAPLNMLAMLRSPDYDLSGYEEVYIEAWFYTVNDLYPSPGGTLYDAPILLVFDRSTGQGTGSYLGIAATGDCTQDPTTENGWRKILYRVPPSKRVSSAFFEFRFVSDTVDQYEGAYIDDIRIIASADVDSHPLGNDTYGGRVYELRNMGQVAGLGTDTNDLHVPEAWAETSVSSSVVVAVIDSGVDLTHPDLNLGTGYEPDGTVGGGPKTDDDNHGTACAGNVGAIYNNSEGVIGTAPGVEIMPVYQGSTFDNVASAIDVAVANGAHVLSNSWGWVGAPSTVIETAIDDALAAGRAVIFAAGNGPDRSPWTYDVAFPGSLTATKDIVTVGASSLTDEHKAAASSDGQFGWGSSYVGSGPDVVAPGPWSYTTDRQGSAGYNDGTALSDSNYDPTFGGTSSSTPKVAGIVALMLSANPNLTPAQIKSILRSTADDIDATGDDDKTGAGRVNAYGAVMAAKQMLPQLSCSPLTLTPGCTVGQNAVSQSFDVWNSGGGTMSYTISDNAAWLSVDPTSGSSTGEHDTIAVNYSTASLSAGTYNGTITVTAAGANQSPQEIAVTLTVSAPASQLSCSPLTLTPGCTVGQNAASQSFDVWNSGGGTMSYTISDNAAWLSVDPTSGSSTGEHDTIAVNYSTVALSAGTYNGTITVTAAGANQSPQEIAVTLTVSAPASQLSCSPLTLSPGCTVGQNAASQSFDVWNSGGGTMSYTISDNAAWLSVDPTSGSSTGEHDTIAVNYSTVALSAGTYNGTITVTAAGANQSPQEIAVTLIVTAGSQLECSPLTLTASCREGQNALSQSFEVWNSGGGTMSYTISDNAAWLSVDPTSGSSTGEHDTINVHFSTASLSQGSYNGTITVTAGSETEQVTVSLTVQRDSTITTPILNLLLSDE